MAGITANTATVSMASGISADAVNSGYVTGEEVTLGPDPASSTYAWTLSAPVGSGAVLTQSDVSGPKFTPEVAGYYVITVTIDSVTIYVLRIDCVKVSTAFVGEALRLPPRLASTIPTPTTGVSLFLNSADSKVTIKKTDGLTEALH